MLSMPAYADRIQVQLDRLLAEKGKEKADSGAPKLETEGASLL
jgi:hypothetical protein